MHYTHHWEPFHRYYFVSPPVPPLWAAQPSLFEHTQHMAASQAASHNGLHPFSFLRMSVDNFVWNGCLS